jgi:hypothetical protein
MLLPDLHDATFNNLSLEWETANASLEFRTGVSAPGVATIHADSVTNLKCSHLLPWGPSSSVNVATLETRTTDQLLTIEMQSGDVIEICCREVRLK